jgi:hypothetical protein
MISDRDFSRSYSGVWETLLPAASETIRKINQLSSKYHRGVRISVVGEWRPYVGELGFRVFEHATKEGQIPKRNKKARERLEKNTRAYISRLGGNSPGNSDQIGLDITWASAVEEAESLLKYVKKEAAGEKVVTRPHFRGCGILDDCKGDILTGSLLIEVKSTQGSFDQVAVRQLLIYSTLAMHAGKPQIELAGLCNPYLGNSIIMRLDDLAFDLAGLSAISLQRNIAEYLTVDLSSPLSQ